MTHDFNQLDLHPQLVQAITELGYTTPTPIQAAVIPVMLAGQDVMGQAHTGTGKTATFALPLLQRLGTAERPGHVQALILVPTRELALQVTEAFRDYGRYHNVQVLAVYGGQPYSPQIRQLKQGVDVVVGTPGRLLDLMQRQALDLSGVNSVVLDEADEMLSMGFIDDIETILQSTPSNRQTTLFSATLPPEIRRLADRYLQHPRSITIAQPQRTVATTEQRYYLVNAADKLAALTRLLEVEDMHSTLIFTRTRVGTGELAAALSARGFPAEALSGNLQQASREQVLQRFRQHQVAVLVATDVAARGLDIDGVSHVINYDMPHDAEAYVHRIGRTGRAGKAGVAITLLTPKEQWRLRKIETYTKQKMTPATLPSEADIHAHREAVLLERVSVWLRRGRYSKERALVTGLMQAGYDPVDIAAAALKLARAEEKQRPILPLSAPPEERPRERKRSNTSGHRDNGRRRADMPREPGMVQLTLSAGKAQGIRPNDVLGSIAAHADVPGRSIGAIRIQEQYTLVDVPKRFVAQVLAKKQYTIRHRAITVDYA
jgi:ATP-dependent RNA helicase DeaD